MTDFFKDVMKASHDPDQYYWEWAVVLPWICWRILGAPSNSSEELILNLNIVPYRLQSTWKV